MGKPKHREVLVAAGWSKRDVREYVHERARVTRGEWRGVGKAAVVGAKADAVHTALRSPDDLLVVDATRDIAETLAENGFTVARSQVLLHRPIKTIGMHEIAISLHPEVEVPIAVNVARTPEEAERQARGEDLTRREPFGERPEPEEEAVPELEEVFEHPEAVQLGEEGEAAEAEAEVEPERD